MAYNQCHPDRAPRVDRLLRTLSHPFRRELVHYFEAATNDDVAPLGAVVTHIDGRIPSTNPAELETALHHTHLPKLETRGWVDYDHQDRAIRYLGNEDAAPLLTELAIVFSA